MSGIWRSAEPVMRLLLLLAVVGGLQATVISPQSHSLMSERKFNIENNRFVKDGKPLQIISGR